MSQLHVSLSNVQLVGRLNVAWVDLVLVTNSAVDTINRIRNQLKFIF